MFQCFPSIFQYFLCFFIVFHYFLCCFHCFWLFFIVFPSICHYFSLFFSLFFPLFFFDKAQKYENRHDRICSSSWRDMASNYILGSLPLRGNACVLIFKICKNIYYIEMDIQIHWQPDNLSENTVVAVMGQDMQPGRLSCKRGLCSKTRGGMALLGFHPNSIIIYIYVYFFNIICINDRLNILSFNYF